MKRLTQAADERIDRYYKAIPDFIKKEMYQSDVKTKHGISNGDWFIKKGFAVKVGHYYEFRDGITRDEIKEAMGYAITKESELPLEVINTIKDATTVESMHSGDLKKSSVLKTYWTNLTESDYFLARCFFNSDGILVFNLGTIERVIYIERSVNKTGHEEPHNLLKRTLYKFDPIRNRGKIYNRGSKGYYLVPVDCLDIVPPIEQIVPVKAYKPLTDIEKTKIVNEVITTTALSFRGDLAKSLFISMMNGRDMSGNPIDYEKLICDSFYMADILIIEDKL
jgi:hypothetical protein